ncbi:MAG: pitrilysin family protein [Myxococcota bacterium]|nr:pitrilysin family protein [Myxococcota bacterium]
MIVSLLLACATVQEPAPEPSVSPIPQPGPTPEWTAPAPQVSDLDNGAKLWVLPDSDLPLISLRIVFPGGAATDPEGAAGAAYMAGLLMEEGAGERGSMEMTRSFERLAASASIDVEMQAVIASLDVAADRFDEAYQLMVDQLLRPLLQREDFERIQYQQILSLEEAREDGPQLAREVAHQLYFGNSPYGRPVMGTPDGIRALSYEATKDAYLRLIRPGGATFVVTGDVAPESIAERLLTPLEGWTGELDSNLELPAPRTAGGLYVVSDPGASQTAIRVVGHGPKAGHVDRLAASAAAVVIGGSFTSRLNYLLREKKGYTYGAWAQFNSERDFGVFSGASNVRADATVAALQDMLGVFESAGEGFDAEDVQKAHSQSFTDEVGAAATRSDLADVFAERAGDGLRPDGWAKELELTMSASASDMQALGGRFMAPETLTIVLAGDLDTLLPALDGADLTPFGEYTVVEPLP